MSVKIMSQVWELDLPHNAQSIFLALADHADDDGYCYPSVGRLAWKTGYGVRQVQRTLKDLRDQKLAIPTGSVVGGRHNTVVPTEDRTPDIGGYKG
jgi:DNA-directed RNA polymerase specialized sigma54-like protein